MTESTGPQANAAVFAAHGAARPRLARAAVAAGIALVAAWLIALALGVLGGFDALPGLPGAHSRPSTDASSHARRGPAPVRVRTRSQAPAAAPNRAATPPSQLSGGGRSISPSPKPPASAPTVTQAPSHAGATTGSAHGQSSSPTTTGKPVGSPGNGPGGSGAPGQLR